MRRSWSTICNAKRRKALRARRRYAARKGTNPGVKK